MYRIVPSQQRITQPKILILLKLRNPDLEKEIYVGKLQCNISDNSSTADHKMRRICLKNLELETI
jgi:hypothetical protein